MYYNQGKWISEHKYGKGWYYNEYYNDDLDLVTDKSFCIGELEAESHNDSVPQEMFFAKKHLEKLSTFVNAFTPWKFYNNPVQVEENNDKWLGLACFLKIICQNEKCLKSKINSLANMANKDGQFFEINHLF